MTAGASRVGCEPRVARGVLSCERIQSFNPNFDCDEFPDRGVVTSTLAWNTMVPSGSPIDITWYDEDL